MKINKNTTVNIIVSQNLTKTEMFAAEELAKYIKLILNTTPSLSEAWVEGACNFIIGNPCENQEALRFVDKETFAATVSGPEGMYIEVKEDDVLIAGSNDNDNYNRGTLYAVYEFLERYAGCCFGAYSGVGVNAGEIVPILEKLDIDNSVYIKQKADLPYRTAILQYNFWVGNAEHELNPAFFDWLAKNRYNRILTWVGIYNQYVELGMVPELEKRGIRLSVGHHQSIPTWLPAYGSEEYPTKYAEAHPEFFRLQEDGTRFIPKEGDFEGQFILCNRNEEVIEEVAKNIIQWAKKNPIVDIITFWPNDGISPGCCCEECSKYSKHENYLYFENELAKRISKVLPDLKIDVLIYNDLWECPEDLKLCDNIIIDESTWAYTGLRSCGKPDGSGLLGTHFYKNIQDYRRAGKNVVFYEYYMGNYGNQQKVMPSADELQSIYQSFVKDGISGSGTQMECFNLWNNLLNFYCFARTAYDTSLALDVLIERISKLFGAGSAYIKDILKIYEETLDGQVPISETGDYFVSNVDRERVYKLFEKALEATENERFRNNVRLLRMAFRYTILSTMDASETEKNELDYMYTHFNSYLVSGGYGIAIPNRNNTDVMLSDKWYEFEK